MTRHSERPQGKEGHRWTAELYDHLVLTASGADAQRFGPASVLLVSSDRRHHSEVGGPLRDGGCQLQHAYTIEQAVPIVDAGAIDVVIAAEQFSDGSWLTLRCECNRRIMQAPEVAFIIMLSHSDLKRAADLLKDGASDTVAHPPDQARLLRAVAVAHARVMRAREIRRARMSNPGFQTPLINPGAEEQS